MKRCDPNARSRCPTGEYCELYAEFMDGSECDKFNEMVLTQPMTNADRIRAMTEEELAMLLARFEYDVAKQICAKFGVDITIFEHDFEAAAKEHLQRLQQPAEGIDYA